MQFENIKDRCRYYQSLYDYRLMPNTYIILHVDGKNFSKKVKNSFERPFDDDFIMLMNDTTRYLCENTQNALCAFVQSDEISVVIKDCNDTSLPYGGRLCKFQSITAALATSMFNKLDLLLRLSHLAGNAGCTAGDCVNELDSFDPLQFDCKAWCVPSLPEAVAWLQYRQIDCIRNSKEQTAQAFLPHSELVGRTSDEQIAILLERTGNDWNELDDGKKYGRFLYRKPVKFVSHVNGKDIESVRNRWQVSYDGAFNLLDEAGRDDFYAKVLPDQALKGDRQTQASNDNI